MAGKALVILLGSALGTSLVWAAFVFPSAGTLMLGIIAGGILGVTTVVLAGITLEE